MAEVARSAGEPGPGAVEGVMVHLLAEALLVLAALALLAFVVVDGINNGDWR